VGILYIRLCAIQGKAIDMEAVLQDIKQYVLNPDQRGSHLRQLAEYMGKLAWENDAGKPRGERWQEVRDSYVEGAAEQVAGFIHMGWDGAGPDEYAPRTFEIMRDYQDSMSGMDLDTRWNDYTLPKMANEIGMRMKLAEKIAIDAKAENALVRHLFDDMDEYSYLHDIVGQLEHLHWQRKHSFGFKAWLMDHPEHPLYPSLGKKHYPWGDRKDPAVEEHLRMIAIEGLAIFIEQSNIVRPDGNILNPTDPRIIYKERISLQDHHLGGRNALSWEESGWRVANRIEDSFGTTEGRKAGRRARLGWPIQRAKKNEGSAPVT